VNEKGSLAGDKDAGRERWRDGETRKRRDGETENRRVGETGEGDGTVNFTGSPRYDVE
jgi:hypothetical protein